MDPLSTIRAFQKILTTFQFSNENLSFPEEFAIKRFSKKMEIPDKEKAKLRAEACFDTWLSFDESLRLPRLLPGNWYKARLLIHHWCEDFRLDPIVFTNGSESAPTYGFNSIESKLMRSKWECSADCFDLWAETAYRSLALKRSTRQRFLAVMKHDELAIRSFHKESYKRFAEHRDFQFLCFKRTLSYVTFVRDASRFSTVRKNNKVDRPIDVQPLCNMLVQRRIGNGLRSLLLKNGVDLNSLATQHRERIQNGSIATIDLKNASDSIHIDLIRFLFPTRVFSLIERSRMFYVEAPSGDYIVPNKVSSMGNGFTFELMTVIIRALGLQFDENFSVFGDDIIIDNQYADDLMVDLRAVGFVPNVDKTFIRSAFRESCGGNYHDAFGYIESYDFEYPESIHDCVVLHNKAFALARKYPQFKRLSQLLARTVPTALRGPAFAFANDGRRGYDHQINLSSTFWFDRIGGVDWSGKWIKRKLHDLCYDHRKFKMIYGYVYKPKLASKSVSRLDMRRHTGKYFMYLNACKRVDDTVTDRGSWQEVAFLTDGVALFRVKSLKG
jgi:hypothetical protein